MFSQTRSMECLLQAGPWAVSSLEKAVLWSEVSHGVKTRLAGLSAWLPGPPWCLLANNANHANQRLLVALVQFRVCDACLAL